MKPQKETQPRHKASGLSVSLRVCLTRPLLAGFPFRQHTAAQDFCARNGIALQIFTVSEEVQRAHLNDIGDFLDEHEGDRVRAEYVPGIKKAV